MRRVNLLRAHGSPTEYLRRHRGCRCVACRGASLAHNRKYQAEHREEGAEYSRNWRAEHAEGLAESKHKYYAEHRDEITESLRKHRAENRDEILERKYGLPPGKWGAMFAAQGNGCAICRTTEPGGLHDSWCTDHDHDTGKVRGILCHKHNLGLGYFHDNPEHLMAAIEYLAAATP